MGRKSKNEYPPDWPEIAIRIKAVAGWKCIRCGHEHDVWNGFMLTVHHLDLDKSNCAWWNTLALCQRCHLRIQGKVVLERPWMFEHSDWFKPYVAGYYASIHGYPTDRDFVMNNLNFLLSLAWPQFTQGNISQDALLSK